MTDSRGNQKVIAESVSREGYEWAAFSLKLGKFPLYSHKLRGIKGNIHMHVSGHPVIPTNSGGKYQSFGRDWLGLLEIKTRSFKVCLLVDVIALSSEIMPEWKGRKVSDHYWEKLEEYLSIWMGAKSKGPRHSAVWFYFFGTGKKAQRVLNQTKEAKWF